MIPSAFEFLDGLPLCPNGKVDRRRLPAPAEQTATEVARPFIAPRTLVESTLAGIFANLLGVERVGVHDDFFALGGDSLLAMRAAARARKALCVEIPLAALLAAPTVERLAGVASQSAVCRETAWSESGHPLASIVAALSDAYFATRLLVRKIQHLNKPATNINRVYRVRGRLDTGVLEEAIKTLIARHESLRTTFGEVEGTPCQRVGPVRLQLTQVDLSHFAAVDRVAAAREPSVAEAKYRFDRANDPMLRTLLIRLDAQDNVLALTLDHIALDGWSLAILLRELETLYDSLSAGVRAALPELPFQPVDLGAWEVGSFRGEASQRHLAYWKHQLAGATGPAQLPGDGPRANFGEYRSIE